MLSAPCYIIADVHLGVAPRETERALVQFLRALPGRAGSLLINGDLFDFWFEWRAAIPRTGFRVLAALADVVDAGVPVTWIAGNHDQIAAGNGTNGIPRGDLGGFVKND